MNRLASILPPAQVLVSVDVTSKKRAFEEAGLLFESQHGLSRALITDSLFARERLGSTGLGHGVAIPHGRIKGLKSPMAAVFQLAQPIGFDAPDEQPVSLLIFLLVPEAATQKHLEILSEIAELLSDGDENGIPDAMQIGPATVAPVNRGVSHITHAPTDNAPRQDAPAAPPLAHPTGQGNGPAAKPLRGAPDFTERP